MMPSVAKVTLWIALGGGIVLAVLAWPAEQTDEAVVLAQRPSNLLAQSTPSAAMPGVPGLNVVPAIMDSASTTSRGIASEEAYATAVEIANCQQRSLEDSGLSHDWSDAYQLDPTGALAADLQREALKRAERCRLIGPSDYRRIDALLQDAADRGSLDARSLQWRRRLDGLLSRFHRGEAATEDRLPFGPQERAEAAAVAAGLETLALTGHGESINALQQLLSSDGAGIPDPVRAAAWRLVSYQTAGQDLPPEDQMPGRIEVLEDLDDTTRTQAVRLSRLLFETCCRRTH